MVLRLNNDSAPTWVQAHLPNADGAIIDNILTVDPLGEGLIAFENGVTAYMLLTPRGLEVEAIGDQGTLTAMNDGGEWLLRQRVPVASGSHRTELQAQPFEAIPPASSTLRLIEDLVHALDTGEAPRGGVRKALTTMELIFGFIESYQRGGARVDLPLQDRSLRLQSNTKPRQPKFEA